MYLYPSSASPPPPTSNSYNTKTLSPSHLHSKTMNMKQSFHARGLILLLIILVSSSTLSARFLATEQGLDKVKLDEINTGGFQVELEGGESIDQLMGTEKCDNGDEECFKRRAISEAHLDYIYTQQHKP